MKQSNIIKAFELPNIVYFHNGHQEGSYECTDKISTAMGCTYTMPSTWAELTDELVNGARFVAFHLDMIDTVGPSISEFIEAVTTIVRYIPREVPLQIGVVINKDSKLDSIKQLQNTCVSGILLDVHDFPMDEVVKSTYALVNGKSYWPNHIISQLPADPKKPLVIYFRNDWQSLLTASAAKKVTEVSELDLKFISTWDELHPAIKLEPAQIIFHADVVTAGGHSVDQVISMIQTNIELILPEKTIPLSIGIDKTTTQNQVKEFQKAKLRGVVPAISAFGFVESKTAVTTLLAGETYWPDHIISQLPVDPVSTLPRVVSLRINQETNWTKTIMQQVQDNPHYHIDFCDSWDSFATVLESPTDLILFHCKMIKSQGLTPAELVDMVSSVSRYVTGKLINIAVVIDKDTTQDRIKELRKLDLRGIVPSSMEWGVEIGVPAVVSILNGELHWPKDIIDQLPGAVKKVKSNTPGIRLTARQLEVMELVCKRGLSNKGVAKMLKISESTVKIHVSAVMKAYGVRNRTQLALTASSNLKA